MMFNIMLFMPISVNMTVEKMKADLPATFFDKYGRRNRDAT